MAGEDEQELLFSVHQLRSHVLHGRRAVLRHSSRRRAELLGMGARLGHQARGVALHRNARPRRATLFSVPHYCLLILDPTMAGIGGIRAGSFSHIMVHTEERPPLRLNVQPAAARDRFDPRLGDPRREALRWKVDKFTDHGPYAMDSQIASFSSGCSVTGSALIVGGLYSVLWGKGREIKQLRDVCQRTNVDGDDEGGAVAAVGLPLFSCPSKLPIHQVEAGQP